MLTKAKDFPEIYLDWLRKKFVISDVGEYVRIDAPFLDRHNDFVTIYVKSENGGYFITDDAFTITDLQMTGCDLSTPKRKSTLNEIIAGFGVGLTRDNELTIHATDKNFALKKHMLIQAMLSVNDMFMMAQSSVASIFLEDIALFLSKNNIRFSESVQMPGHSGLSHRVDFLIPRSEKAAERIVKGINSPTKTKIKSTLFAWNDIRPLRKSPTKLYILYNDTKTMSTDLIVAIKSCDATPIAWSAKNNFVDELTA